FLEERLPLLGGHPAVSVAVDGPRQLAGQAELPKVGRVVGPIQVVGGGAAVLVPVQPGEPGLLAAALLLGGALGGVLAGQAGRPGPGGSGSGRAGTSRRWGPLASRG